MQPVSSPVEHLPAIDVSEIDSRTGDQILEAASKWGFLYIRNHGFTAEVLERAFDLVRAVIMAVVARSESCCLNCISVAPIFQVSTRGETKVCHWA